MMMIHERVMMMMMMMIQEEVCRGEDCHHQLPRLLHETAQVSRHDKHDNDDHHAKHIIIIILTMIMIMMVTRKDWDHNHSHGHDDFSLKVGAYAHCSAISSLPTSSSSLYSSSSKSS